MKLIPDEVKRQILGLWMGGMTLRQVSLEKKVSTGEISNIINAYRQGNPGLDELRKLNLALGEAKATLPDALRGAEFLRKLDELEFDGKYLPECLNFIRKAGVRAPELASAGGRLIELEKKSGKSYDRFLLEFNEQLKAQANLLEKVKNLEGRDLELRHSIRNLHMRYPSFVEAIEGLKQDILDGKYDERLGRDAAKLIFDALKDKAG